MTKPKVKEILAENTWNHESDDVEVFELSIVAKGRDVSCSDEDLTNQVSECLREYFNKNYGSDEQLLSLTVKMTKREFKGE